MRLPVALALVLVALPSSLAAAQAPPVVVIGPPPAASGPPPQAAPSVPPGYEIEGELGGMHFRAQITTPAPVPVAPQPQPQVIVPAPVPAPVIVVQAPPPQPQPVVQYQYAPTYPQLAPQQPPMQDRAPRLDSGMDFVPRVALELLGAGLGFGLATGIAYLASDRPRDDGFAPTLFISAAGLVPAGISIFGGAIAGGRGRYGGALLGELIGGGLSATILFAADLAPNDPWAMIAAIAGPAVLGALIGFEAQHGLRTARLEQRMERSEGMQLSGVSVSPTAQGSGALVGMSGTF
jgi:hypothetical protein